ncbi:MAG: nucleotide sugar dehydrogenase [Desulfobacterales bacterium]|nr:nucleotide sugar dehydrogenase [Desulfobacterales bacterium]
MQISVFGLGKLGLCTAACLARAGYRVLGFDIRGDYLEELLSYRAPFEETGLNALLQKVRDKLVFYQDPEKAAMESDVSFIIVPTPSQSNGAFSNEFVLQALETVAPVIAKKSTFHLINIVSTVMPGSCEKIFVPFLEGLSGKKASQDFGVTYNPEFIAIGSVIENFLNPDLVLIGESDKYSGKILEEIYRRTCDNSPFMARTNLINAEIAKLSINCFCTMKISFANNLSQICDAVTGARPEDICHIIGHDSRIGTPYLQPGLGFGGPCFPRDNEAFVQFASGVGGFAKLQEAVIEINARQVDRITGQIKQAVEQYGNAVALLGQTYKPNTYLTERSQALEIGCKLVEAFPENEIRVYDPMANVAGKWKLADSLKECVTGARVVAILTPWSEFLNTDWHRWLANPHVVLNYWEELY